MNEERRSSRIAIVHDWLTGRRGGERVLEELLVLFPDADLFTLIHKPGRVPTVEHRPIHSSLLNRLPLPGSSFQLLLPFFNRAMRGLRLDGYELVISISHCCAKNVTPPPTTPHLCYCLTPARYIWDLFEDYQRSTLGPFHSLLRPLSNRVCQAWRQEDQKRAQHITRFVAISRYVQQRITRCYNRSSSLVYPPVATERFQDNEAQPSDRFLVLSALRPNKNVAAIVEACRDLQLPLDVIGPGSKAQIARLQRLGGSSVTIHGELSDQEVNQRLPRCRALIHAANEDFGIAPVEAMAAGRPVIGFRHCGLAETVVDQGPKRTGLLFDDPSPNTIKAAIQDFIRSESQFSPQHARQRAALFSTQRFRQQFLAEVDALRSEHARTS